jgi:diketogulonate reductase-like aldo/keto reductase
MQGQKTTAMVRPSAAGCAVARLQNLGGHIVAAGAVSTANTKQQAAAGAAAGAAEIPLLELSNGLMVPAVGYGCALFSLQPDGFSIDQQQLGGAQGGQGDLAPLREKVEQALDAGYTHLDTAHCYHTEIPIGQVLAERMAAGALRREKLWITTKTSDPILPANDYMFDPDADSYQGVLDEFAGCLERLQIQYVDLLLLHWPGPKPEPQAALGVERPAGRLTSAQAQRKRADMWRALEHIYGRGQARSIGVSNWTQRHLEPLLAPGAPASFDRLHMRMPVARAQ